MSPYLASERDDAISGFPQKTAAYFQVLSLERKKFSVNSEWFSGPR
jgi:hypothetical protein